MKDSPRVAAKTILLVDSDERSQTVLAVSLKKAGFDVTTASSAEGALDLATTVPPELVLSETKLPGQSGYDLCRAIKAHPETHRTAFAFLSEDDTPEAKIEGINAGADDFLVKPIFVKEIVARIGSIFERRDHQAMVRRDATGNFAGDLSGMALVDLLQLFDVGQKTGTLRVVSEAARAGGFAPRSGITGYVYFRSGQPIDAELGQLKGEDAVYRMLLWADGEFEMEFGPVDKEAVIDTPAQGLLLEGMRRVDEWSTMEKDFPELGSRLEADYKRLRDVIENVPEEAQEVLRLFDGKRTILEVLDEAPVDDLHGLQIVSRLLADEILLESGHRRSLPPPASLSLGDWLSSAPKPRPKLGNIPNLPSEIGRVMIPTRDSAESASQILRAVDPTQVQEGRTERRPSILVRQTVQADQPVPSTRSRAPSAGSPPVVETQEAPRLTKRVVTTDVGPDPRLSASSGPEASVTHAVPTAPARFSSQSHLTRPEPTQVPEPVDSERPRAHENPWRTAAAAPIPSPSPSPAAPAPTPSRPAPTPVQSAPEPAPPPGFQPRHSIEPSNPGIVNYFEETLPPTGVREQSSTFALIVGGALIVGVIAVFFFGGQGKKHELEAPAPAPIVSAEPPPAIPDPAPEPAPIEEPEPAPDPEPVGPDPALAEAEAALAADKYEEARQLFSGVIERDAQNAQAEAGLAMALFGLRKDPEAKERAEAALAKNDQTALAHLVLGFIHSNRGDEASATQRYQRYLELEPTGRYATELKSFLKTK